MLRVPIHQALSGMRLALPIQDPHRATMLLCEGYVLDDALVRKLVELQIGDIWIHYPNTEQIKQFISPAVLNQQSRLIGMMADTFDQVHREAHAPIDFSCYRKTIQSLIEALVSEPTAASYIVEMGGAAANNLRHSSEVCFLSILMGLKLQGYLIQQRKRLRPKDARDVVALGIGAMLHDIGYVKLGPEVRERYERTRDESDLQWRKHVRYGHRMISGSIPPAAAGVVLHHHQHFDGSGFPISMGRDGRPRGLAGDSIHVFARIACVANHFDRLRRADDGTITPRVRVLNRMLTGPLTSRFDPVVLAVLPLVVPAYPPGSIVTLNSGQKAVVVAWHPEAPCQPTLQLTQMSGPRPSLADEVMPGFDLRHRTDLMVIESEGQRVQADNFRLIPPLLEAQKIVQKDAA